MFTIARNLTNLVSADIIYGDGTFYTSPTQFTQLYTLHAMVDDVTYSLVFNRICGVIVICGRSLVRNPVGSNQTGKDYKVDICCFSLSTQH